MCWRGGRENTSATPATVAFVHKVAERKESLCEVRWEVKMMAKRKKMRHYTGLVIGNRDIRI